MLLFLSSQARAKEEREAKKAKLDGRHEYLLGNIADVLNIEYNEVVEHVLEGSQVEEGTDLFIFCSNFKMKLLPLISLIKNNANIKITGKVTNYTMLYILYTCCILFLMPDRHHYQFLPREWTNEFDFLLPVR